METIVTLQKVSGRTIKSHTRAVLLATHHPKSHHQSFCILHCQKRLSPSNTGGRGRFGPYPVAHPRRSHVRSGLKRESPHTSQQITTEMKYVSSRCTPRLAFIGREDIFRWKGDGDVGFDKQPLLDHRVMSVSKRIKDGREQNKTTLIRPSSPIYSPPFNCDYASTQMKQRHRDKNSMINQMATDGGGGGVRRHVPNLPGARPAFASRFPHSE